MTPWPVRQNCCVLYSLVIFNFVVPFYCVGSSRGITRRLIVTAKFAGEMHACPLPEEWRQKYKANNVSDKTRGQ
jgi:hypothetical protein